MLCSLTYYFRFLYRLDLDERKKEKKPEFLSGLEDMMGIEGMETRLSCRLLGYPKPEITWLRDGRPIKADEDYYMTFDGTDSSLYIRDTHPVHADTYTCQVYTPCPYRYTCQIYTPYTCQVYTPCPCRYTCQVYTPCLCRYTCQIYTPCRYRYTCQLYTPCPNRYTCQIYTPYTYQVYTPADTYTCHISTHCPRRYIHMPGIHTLSMQKHMSGIQTLSMQIHIHVRYTRHIYVSYTQHIHVRLLLIHKYVMYTFHDYVIQVIFHDMLYINQLCVVK